MISKNMIFRNTLFGVAVCLAGVLTACAEKELSELTPVADESEVEICFTPTVGADITTKGSDVQPIGETGLYLRTIISENKTNPFDEAATRATLVNGFDPDGAEGTYSTFRVYSFLHQGAWEENSADATPYINGIDAVSLGNGYWGFEESVFWPSWDTNMTFLAYAPVDGGVDISFTEEDESGNSSYVSPTLVYSDPAVINDETHHGEITAENLAKQCDLLVAQTPDLTKETTTIPMSFSHVFAAVEFICGDMTEGTISKLSLVNIAHEGVYDFGTGTWDVDSDNRTEYVFPLTVTVPGLKEGEELEEGENMPSYGTSILSGSSALMMVPQDLTGSVLLIEYTPAGENESKMELAVELSGSWEAGAHITYHISFLSGADDIIPYLDGQDGYFAKYVLAHYDEDENGHISQEEADKVTELKIGYYPDDTTDPQTPDQRIDFTGIEHFTNLTSFTSNYASALDVTQNAKLTYICLRAEVEFEDAAGVTETATPNVNTLDLSKNTEMTEIADYAFYGNSNLANVTLPSTITKIGDYAFYGVSRDNEPRFEGIELPTAVTTIGDYAFDGCAHLTTINLENVTSLGKYAFYNCSRLAAADLSKLTVINEHTFMDCKRMTDLTLSENLTAIGAYAFYSCDTLSTNLVIPKGVETVSDYAFYDCHYLPSLEISEGVKVLGDHSFYRCGASFAGTATNPATAKVTLPSTLTKIGEYAFGDAGIIPSGSTMSEDPIPTEFVLPAAGFPALVSIGAHAFANCVGLTTFPVSVIDIEKAGTGELEMPTSATCKLTTVGERAFYGCAGLTSVTLPSTVTTLGNYAFFGCSKLGAFVCESENPPSTDTYTLEFEADPKPVLYVYKSHKPNYTAESSGYWTTGASGKFSGITNIDAADDPVDESASNHEKYTNGTLVIGTKTVSQSTYGTGTDITTDTTLEANEGIYFVDSGATLTIEANSQTSAQYVDGYLIIVGSDFEKRSKVVIKDSFTCEVDMTSSKYYVEMMFYNVDIEIEINGALITFYTAHKGTVGPVPYLAFDNCRITAKNSPVVVDVPSAGSASDPYFSEIYIGDCVWGLPASTSTTQLFNFDDSITGSPTTVTVKNNLFYCNTTDETSGDGLVLDFRFMTANGMTFGTLDYENNTLVNLGTSSTAGLFEYSSISSATVTKNLTYVAEPSSDYVFFHSTALPTTTTGVTDNIAYLGGTNSDPADTGDTHTWYWLYNGESLSNPDAVKDACTVLTESPFSALDVSSETFTVNSQYSGYGYQAPTTSGDTGTTEP